MLRTILCILFWFFIVNAVGQKTQFQKVLDYLNNVTVSDLAQILRYLPIPNPLVFDGDPIGSNDVTFYLYTRQNPNNPVHLKRSSTNFPNLNPGNEVKFIIHGWIEDAQRPYYKNLIDSYLTRGEYNVIAVDWQKPARNEYSTAARNTKTVGRAVGDFAIRLNKLAGIPFSQIHILGHSLGAHVSGFAGKRIISKTGQKAARITAMDAAGPLFETPIPVSKLNRLDKSDAEFVDCVHTDGGIFGMTLPICHADFFPNGGTPRQPGCLMINIFQLSTRVIIDDLLDLISQVAQNNTNINILHYFRDVFCSHYKSHEYYAESINSNGFQSTLCDSYKDYKSGKCSRNLVIPMGEDAPSSSRGKFYLDTNASPPFAKSNSELP